MDTAAAWTIEQVLSLLEWIIETVKREQGDKRILQKCLYTTAQRQESFSLFLEKKKRPWKYKGDTFFKLYTPYERIMSYTSPRCPYMVLEV